MDVKWTPAFREWFLRRSGIAAGAGPRHSAWPGMGSQRLCGSVRDSVESDVCCNTHARPALIGFTSSRIA